MLALNSRRSPMPDVPVTYETLRRSKSRIRDYIILFGTIGLIISAAFYQEEISTFFKLRMWDRGAPGRVVTEFLKAAQKRDQTAAHAYLQSSNMNPLMKDGKWE